MPSFGQNTYLQLKLKIVTCAAAPANLLKGTGTISLAKPALCPPNQLAYWWIAQLDQVSVGSLTLLAILNFTFCAVF